MSDTPPASPATEAASTSVASTSEWEKVERKVRAEEAKAASPPPIQTGLEPEPDDTEAERFKKETKIKEKEREAGGHKASSSPRKDKDAKRTEKRVEAKAAHERSHGTVNLLYKDLPSPALHAFHDHALKNSTAIMIVTALAVYALGYFKLHVGWSFGLIGACNIHIVTTVFT